LGIQFVRLAQELEVAHAEARRATDERAVGAMNGKQPGVAEHVLIPDLDVRDPSAA
jgi:hypothetical protein